MNGIHLISTSISNRSARPELNCWISPEFNVAYMSNRKGKRKEMVRLYGFPACPPVVQYYTLRKAGSRPKQRSWNSHEAVRWQRLWWQRCSAVLSFIRPKVRMTDRSDPLFDRYLLLFSLSVRLRRVLLSSSAFIFCLVFSAPTLSTSHRYSPSDLNSSVSIALSVKRFPSLLWRLVVH